MEFTLEDICDSQTSPKFFFRKAKKYAISEMLTTEEKQLIERSQGIQGPKTKNIEQRKSLYFENMIKQQNKKLYINTFIKKIKRTIVGHQPVNHPTLYLHENIGQDWQGIEIPFNFQVFYSFFHALFISFFLVVVSISLVFQQFHRTQLFKSTFFAGFFINIVEIIKSAISVRMQDGRRFEKLNQILYIYMKGQGVNDFVVFFLFIIEFFLNGEGIISILIRSTFILKVIPLLKLLSFFELTFLQNVFWQQVWALIKLVLINYVFAHFLSLILISMSQIEENNWMQFHDIQSKSEVAQYIWAYYWATTIMLTVGFGDIVPVNTSEALCMIFIETISCMLLAYNINNVGLIIQKLRSYSVQKKKNLKIFQHLNSNYSLSSQLSHRITNYIKQSVEIKKNTSIEQENHFVATLPNSFRIDLLRQCNKHIWCELLFLKNLSQKIIKQLSIRLEKKMGHPEQVIHSRKSKVDLLIFGHGQIAYTYYRSANRFLSANGKSVQTFKIQQDQFKILSLDFLFNGFFSFNVKCLDYTILYKMNKEEFFVILKENPYDYEYHCMMKDKDRRFLNQFEVNNCDICDREKHNLDKCPKLHFLPFREHVVHKYLSNNLSEELMVRLRNPRMTKILYKTLYDRKIIRKGLIRQRAEYDENGANKNTIKRSQILENSAHHIEDSILMENQNENQNQIKQKEIKLEEAAEKIKDRLQRVIHLQNRTEMMWQLQSDIIYDFKYYFQKFNPESIHLQLQKKEKRRRFRIKGAARN